MKIVFLMRTLQYFATINHIFRGLLKEKILDIRVNTMYSLNRSLITVASFFSIC